MEHVKLNECALMIGLLLSNAGVAQDGGAKPEKLARYDAAVEAIIVPNDDPRYAEFNPAVHRPRVVIRNDGSDPLQGISIQYGTEGFRQRMYAWTGRLATGSTIEVELPHLIDMTPGLNTFTVKLGDPNGRKDKDPEDNIRSVRFSPADLLGSPITVRVRTGGAGGWLLLESTRGPVLMERSWSARADTVLSQTFPVPSGSYFLQVVDSVDGQHAAVRVFDNGGALVKAIRSSARKGTVYQFRVEANLPGSATSVTDVALVILPGRGQAVMDAFLEHDGTLRVTNLEGVEVINTPLSPSGTVQRVDLSAMPAGTYTVLVEAEGREVFRGELRVVGEVQR